MSHSSVIGSNHKAYRAFLSGERRRKYWIVKRQSGVKNIINERVACCRRKQPPAKQIMTQLPAAEVTPKQPSFSSVGIDYFGLKVTGHSKTLRLYFQLFHYTHEYRSRPFDRYSI